VVAAKPFPLARKWKAAITSSRFADLEEIVVIRMLAIEEAGETDTTVIEIHTIAAVHTESVLVSRLGADMGG
jgi:hypothetical protein